MLKRALLWLSLIPTLASATQLSPWYEGRPAEFQWRTSYLFQSFRQVASKKNSHYGADANFYSSGISLFYDSYSAEVEIVAAHDRHRENLGWDHFKLTGRYQIFDEDRGDAFTLTTGLSASKVYKQALHDLSSFHHGRFEGEAHLALGKQVLCEQFWKTRIWGVASIGQSYCGSPWLRLNAVWERNWWDCHQVRLFVDTLWGLGGNSLNAKKFKGYGSIDHQSVDLGFRLSRFMPDLRGSTLSFQYAYRIYAKNFPKRANQFLFTFLYPFGLK